MIAFKLRLTALLMPCVFPLSALCLHATRRTIRGRCVNLHSKPWIVSALPRGILLFSRRLRSSARTPRSPSLRTAWIWISRDFMREVYHLSYSLPPTSAISYLCKHFTQILRICAEFWLNCEEVCGSLRICCRCLWNFADLFRNFAEVCGLFTEFSGILRIF